MSKGRPYGIRKQDWDAIKQFEYEQKRNPYVSDGVPIEVQVACPCSFRPYPHILTDQTDIKRHADGKKR